MPATGALAAPAVLGEIDRTYTRTNSFGGATQLASSAELLGHGNNAVIGPGQQQHQQISLNPLFTSEY